MINWKIMWLNFFLKIQLNLLPFFRLQHYEQWLYLGEEMLGNFFALHSYLFPGIFWWCFSLFFPLLFAKYIMTFYLPWSRALRPLCGFPILAISNKSPIIVQKYYSLHEDRIIFYVEKAGLCWVVGLLHL